MLRSILLWALLICMGFQASGQEPYRVVFAGGRSYEADGARFSKLRSGQLLEADAELELVGNSRVVLMDGVGRLVSLGLTGRYVLKDLDMEASGDSSEFFKSVWDEYFQAYDQDISVQEQLLSESMTRPGFELSIPSSSQFFGQQQIIEWAHLSKEGYQVNLINEYGEVFD